MKSLFITLLITIVATAYGQELGFPQDTLARNALFNNRQSMAFDSQGRVHVAYSGSMGTNSASREIFYVMGDGNGFVTTQVTTNSVDDNYPTIVVDKDDNVHIGYEARDASNIFQIFYTRKESGSFIAPIPITEGGVNKATPYCAIGKDSVVHFVYNTFITGTNYAYYKKYDLRDSSLSAEQQLTNAEVTGDFDASIATDSSGHVHIVVKSGSTFGGPLKYFTDRSGTLVEESTGIAGNVDYPRVLVDHEDVIHILYRNTGALVLNVVDNGSGAFGPPTPITPSGQRPAGYHNFAVDDDNRIYIVYQSSVSTSRKGFYLVHGKDGMFSDTIKVYEITSDYLLRNTSAVAARGHGEIAVTYSPSGTRNSEVICDVYMKRGVLPLTYLHDAPEQPAVFALYHNYPNPFNPSTTIRFSVPHTGYVTLKIFNILGREVAILMDGPVAAGTHELRWNAARFSSGLYYYRLTAGTFTSTLPMLLVQ